MSGGATHSFPRLSAIVVVRGDGCVAVAAGLSRVSRTGGDGGGGRDVVRGREGDRGHGVLLVALARMTDG